MTSISVMNDDHTTVTPHADNDDSRPRPTFEQLPPAAQRALKEAEARRKAQKEKADQPHEIGGRGGKDPARFGDWEIKGRTIDF
ncbi:DUF1674 domain-containing protein [Candidatus Phyllobacterium onerii]|uniref:DUF1674 domain-containing protein n=1 Tax=Candidatus Phyllobacterium onerii TaxID=3020828 RepID=UPI00232EB5FA|nr:DUF1674 domain-containing protein [Phyllobacterium sp. IY22]